MGILETPIIYEYIKKLKKFKITNIELFKLCKIKYPRLPSIDYMRILNFMELINILNYLEKKYPKNPEVLLRIPFKTFENKSAIKFCIEDPDNRLFFVIKFFESFL